MEDQSLHLTVGAYFSNRTITWNFFQQVYLVELKDDKLQETCCKIGSFISIQRHELILMLY